jgi:ADP-ribose pyrophosphatase YjhB (NUDIX family)
LFKHKDGKYSIPEDYIKDDELLKISCIRIVQEKTGLNIVPTAMFGVYDAIDRNYSERTIGVYYLTHVDMLQEHADKLVQEQNAKLKSENPECGYELFLLSLVDIANQEYLYDHKTIINNYFRILMLGSQTFTKKTN